MLPDRPANEPRLPDPQDRCLQRFDWAEAVTLLDSVPADHTYGFVPPALAELWESVRNQCGASGFDAFQRTTMLALMERFEERAAAKRYTDSIKQCFRASFERIRSGIADPSFEGYRTVNDILLKDLAICRQKLFPAGATLVQPDSAFHRTLLFRDGIAQGLRFARLLSKLGGNKPLYEFHTHVNELGEFNPDGWDKTYLRIAEMLEVNPEVRGVWGGGWFRDPALETLSPHLSYLRQRPVQNGAWLFFSHVDLTGGALSTSRRRRDLYRSGHYLPKSYAMIWPRWSLISWAKQFREQSEHA